MFTIQLTNGTISKFDGKLLDLADGNSDPYNTGIIVSKHGDDRHIKLPTEDSSLFVFRRRYGEVKWEERQIREHTQWKALFGYTENKILEDGTVNLTDITRYQFKKKMVILSKDGQDWKTGIILPDDDKDDDGHDNSLPFVFANRHEEQRPSYRKKREIEQWTNKQNMGFPEFAWVPSSLKGGSADTIKMTDRTRIRFQNRELEVKAEDKSTVKTGIKLSSTPQQDDQHTIISTQGWQKTFIFALRKNEQNWQERQKREFRQWKNLKYRK
jgi:hypothetical protein